MHIEHDDRIRTSQQIWEDNTGALPVARWRFEQDMPVSAEDEETPCFASNDNARRGTQPLASDFALACKPSPAVPGWASPQDREDKKREHVCAGHRTPLDTIPHRRNTHIIPAPRAQKAESNIRPNPTKP